MNLAVAALDFKIPADQLIRDDPVADEFVCKICLVHVVGCGPQLTKCSHLFCGDCLEQWFSVYPSNLTWAQRANTGGAVPCPVCKTSLWKETDVYPVEEGGNENSACLWQMIQGLQMKCSCCEWKGECGSYRDHLQSGSCGTVEAEVNCGKCDGAESEDLASEALSALQQLDKQRPSSPSTSSEISNTGQEELNIDCSLSASTEEESDGDRVSAPAPLCAEESYGKGLTCLIQNLMDLESADSSVSAPDDDMHIEYVSHTRALMISKPDAPLQTEAQARKPNKKKQASKKNTAKTSNKTSSICLTREDVRAHQWQVASYRLAYAQQYQMAIQASRMQQYYQQVRVFAGGVM